MDTFGFGMGLSMIRADCFSEAPDESDFTEDLGESPATRSCGGLALLNPTPAPMRDFSVLDSLPFQDFPEMKQQSMLSKFKTLEPSLQHRNQFDVDKLSESVSAWDFPQISTPAEPKAEPDWVSPHSSLLSDDNASTLFADIQTILTGAKFSGLSFEAFPQKYKIKAVLYDGALPTDFSIRLYKGKTAAVTIEFHHKSGSVRDLFTVFREVASRLGSRVRTYSNQPLVSEPSSPEIELERLPSEGSLVPTLALSTLVRSLMMLAQSEYLDQQKQAFAELAALSAANREVVAAQQTELLPVITEAMKSPDQDLVRCAAIILANISEHSHTSTKPLSQPEQQQSERQQQPLLVPESNADCEHEQLTLLSALLSLPVCGSTYNTLKTADTKRVVARAMLAVLQNSTTMSITEQDRFRKEAAHAVVC
jgi:hypothetical protein